MVHPTHSTCRRKGMDCVVLCGCLVSSKKHDQDDIRNVVKSNVCIIIPLTFDFIHSIYISIRIFG